MGLYSTELVNTIHGFNMFVIGGDFHVGHNIKNNGSWEPETVAWMTNNIKPGYSCLDIGSNIGFFTELMARLSGSGGVVHAFEPNVELVDVYMKTRTEAGNSYDNVADIMVYPFGLSTVEDTLSLLVPNENIGGAALTSDNDIMDGYHSMTVRTKNINDLLSDNELNSVDIIKIDIEGYEPFVWKTLYKALKNAKGILIELGPYHPREFLEEIFRDYQMYALNGDGEVNPDYILGYRHHLNISLVKRPNSVN